MERNSRIFHSKEGDLFHEYRQYGVQKKQLRSQCVYGRSKYKCPAKRTLRPKAPNLILSEKDKKGRNRYYLNKEVPINKDDWEFVDNPTAEDHCDFCKQQMSRRDQQFDFNILNHGTAAEVKAEKNKYPRTGPTGAFKRGFRHKQGDKSKYSQKLEIDSTQNEMNVIKNHGARFLAMVTSVPNERQSSYYKQSTTRDVTGISLERINLALKDTAAGGHMPLSRICRVLKKFKHSYLLEHEERVHNNNLHKRRSTTQQREDMLGDILEKFHNLPYFEQLESVPKYAAEIGNIGKMISKSDNLISDSEKL